MVSEGANLNKSAVFPVRRATEPIQVSAADRLALSSDALIDEPMNVGISSGQSSNGNVDMGSSEVDRNAMSVSSKRSSSVYSNLNEMRNNKVRRYWLKKQHRINQKTVRYGCRQNLAKQRFRHQGRFITKAEMEQLDPEQIYDPNMR